MKKENRKLAQQKRAKQRKQQKLFRSLKKFLTYFIPTAALAALVLLVALHTPGENASDSAGSADSSSQSSSGTSDTSAQSSSDGSDASPPSSSGTSDASAQSSSGNSDASSQNSSGGSDASSQSSSGTSDTSSQSSSGGSDATSQAAPEDGSQEEGQTASYLTDASLTVADGDTVNIDYTGYVDGTAFAGGSTDGNGTRLVIGSHFYIDDFEEQLIGHHPGETVEVNVTFPEDYGNASLNGKEARFEVVINGIYPS